METPFSEASFRMVRETLEPRPIDHAAGAHLNGAQLAFVTVAENNHIIFADIVPCTSGLAVRNDHTALLKPLVNIANLERAVKHIDQIPIAGLSLRRALAS